MDAALRTSDAERAWARWLRAGLLLLFVAVSVQYTIKITCSERDNRSAFLRWRDQILDLSHGVNIYDEHNYPNPPIMALLFQPLAQLPPLVGSLLWFYLKVAMALLVFRWGFQLVEETGRPIPLWAKCLAVLLSLRPILGDLTHGNINIFILFLMVAALVALRSRRDLCAGLLLGLAIACKVTPALLVPYLVWKRAWVALAGCAAGLVLFLWLLPGIFLGHQHNMFLLREWVDQMIVPYVVDGVVTTEHQNQSLPGLLYRFTTDSPSFSVYDWQVEGYVPVEYHNFISLDPEIPRTLVKVCMCLFAGLVVWTCRSPLAQRQRWRLAAEYSLVMLGMLIFSERTWKHHCVTLVLPFTVLAYGLATVPLSVGRRRVLIALLALAYVLMTTTSSGLFGTDSNGLAKLAQVYGAYVWAHLLLAAALVLLLLQSAAVCALQPPHHALLRSARRPSTVKTNTTVRERSDSDVQQPAEGVRNPRASGSGAEEDSRSLRRRGLD